MEFRAWIEEQSTQRPIEPIQLASPIPVSDLPTPCLLLDAVELEANLKTHGRLESCKRDCFAASQQNA